MVAMAFKACTRRTLFAMLVGLMAGMAYAKESLLFEEEEAFPQSSAKTSSTRLRVSRDKVKVELYYMPQCPGCRQLITTSFSEAFETPGFSEMADVTFIPYTKTTESTKDRYVYDNVLESCALRVIGRDHQELQFSYIECIDHTHRYEKDDPSKVDRSCARAIGLSDHQIRDMETCADSHEGVVLAERNVKQAESMQLRYFPWIVVNRQHTSAIEAFVWDSLFDYVCSVYSGPNKSQECFSDPDDDDSMAEQL